MLDKNRADSCNCQYSETEALIRKIKRFVNSAIHIDDSFDSNYIWILGEEALRKLIDCDYEYLEVRDECILLHNIEVHADYFQMFGDDMSIRLMSDLTRAVD